MFNQNYSNYRVPQTNAFLFTEKKLKNALSSAKPGNKILWFKMGVKALLILRAESSDPLRERAGFDD